MFVLSINAIGQSNNLQLIPIAVVIPKQVDYSNESIDELLSNKISVIITKYGMTDKLPSARFVIFPKISILDKEFTTVAPIQTVLNLEVDIFIADYIDSKKFGSVTLTYKGVGESEEKAYRNALKSIRNNDKIKDFIESSKKLIISYYNENCNKLLLESTASSSQGKYESSIILLSQIPMFSDCFSLAQDSIVNIYMKYSKARCYEYLEQAKACFIKLDIETALDKLSNIFPDCKCYNESQVLYNEIKLKANAMIEEAKALKENEKKQELEKENKRWELLMKNYDLAMTEYKNDKLFQQKMEEKALELAIEKSKNEAPLLKEKQESTILIIK